MKSELETSGHTVYPQRLNRVGLDKRTSKGLGGSFELGMYPTRDLIIN